MATIDIANLSLEERLRLLDELWESLSQNHPFVDGNKRIAVTVAAAFLRMNGYLLEFDDLEAYRFLMDLYESGRMRFSELETWLRSHTRGHRVCQGFCVSCSPR